MAVSQCPRCQRANPANSLYCWFDGGSLLSAQDSQRLAHDFIFPSGRRCPTLEDFAQACRDEWASARDLLGKDAFRQFFVAMGRHDLVRLSQEAMQHSNPDVRLSQFIDGLPVARGNAPKLDFLPRRFTLGRLPVGEKKDVEITVVNLGKGTLQGTMTVNEGADWLSFPDSEDRSHLIVSATKDQRVKIRVDATKLKAAQSYVGQIMIVTSGGVAEVPVRFELVAKPFPKPPFQNARSPRELAEKMRKHPKQAGPILQDGEVERWFENNNWGYPVQGPVAKGLAGVQQFFEAMGLSKAPKLQLSKNDLKFATSYPETVRFQVAVQTPARKWVYGEVRSDRPWLKVLTPKVIGPQQANILLEADPREIATFPPEECQVHVQGNGGQKLSLRIRLEVRDVPKPPEPAQWRAILVFAVLFVVLRLALIPVVDFYARGAAVAEAASTLEITPEPDVAAAGGWLRLPWVPLLAGLDGTFPIEALGTTTASGADRAMLARDFRYLFMKAFLRDVIFWTWWLVPLAAVVWALRSSESAVRNIVPALVAGSVAGVLAAGTVACLFLVVEIVPHVVWSVVFGARGGAGLLPVWILVALVAWGVFGAMVGFVIVVVPGLRRTILPLVRWPFSRYVPR